MLKDGRLRENLIVIAIAGGRSGDKARPFRIKGDGHKYITNFP
jgi:hypothetical protein